MTIIESILSSHGATGRVFPSAALGCTRSCTSRMKDGFIHKDAVVPGCLWVCGHEVAATSLLPQRTRDGDIGNNVWNVCPPAFVFVATRAGNLLLGARRTLAGRPAKETSVTFG